VKEAAPGRRQSGLAWNIMPQQSRLGTGRYRCNVGQDGLTTALDLGALRAGGGPIHESGFNPRQREHENLRRG
jgi:hypothetical protein